MKKILLLLSIVALTACQSKASNSDSESGQSTFTQSAVKKATEGRSGQIPTGVQVLPQGTTYNVNQKPGHLVVIDFNATWCGPCLQFAPIFEEAAQKYAGQVEFISVDVDQHQELAQELGIQSIPFILFIQPDGQLNSWVGFLPQADFFKAIEELK